MTTPHRPPDLGSRIVGRRREGWAIAGMLVGLSCVAVFTSHPGAWIADSRFDHYWDSLDFLGRHRFLWESARGLGAPEVFYTPVVAIALALADVAGLAPAAAERLLHAGLLTLAGMGAFRFMAAVRPFRPTEGGLAAFIYAFNPYTSQFLLPSNIFVSYAMAPWLAWAAIRGARSRRPWRWGATFALAAFAAGTVNPSSLGFALIPAACALAYLAAVDRTIRWRHALGWGLRAGTLTAVVVLPGLVQASVNTELVATALDGTERVRDIARTSSWSESWRGLGFWLTYFGDGGEGGTLRPGIAAYFTQWWVVLATFVLPVGALVTLAWSRCRARLLFASMTIPALALMVGAFPVGSSSPLGQWLEGGYERSSIAYTFRTGYKAGPALMLGLSGLAAVGGVALYRRLGVRPWGRAPGALGRRLSGVVAVVGIATLVVASFPFWTGRVYARADGVERVPDYWREATGWLDARPEPGRVLLLPGTDRTRYRWGYVGDDVFDALLRRPHVQPSGLWQGTARTVNLLHALDERIAGRAYVEGSIGPIARRMGVRWVVVRNDLDWERMNVPRPSDLATLRSDPGLERVATFGAPGENVVDPRSRAVIPSEYGLPPVEVFAVDDPWPQERASAGHEALVVTGDGDAWPRLAGLGLLDDPRPVRYSGDLDPGALADAVASARLVVVTDTARRRAVHVSAEHAYRSHTLAPGEHAGWESAPLFDRAGAHGRATFADAVSVGASSYGSFLRSFDRWVRPSAAFDGERDTAWRVAPPRSPVGEWLRVDLRRPVEVAEAEVTLPDDAPGFTRVTAVSLRFSDGTEVPIDLTRPGATVSFEPRRTAWVEMRITGAEGLGGPGAGISELRIGSLDLAEWIRVPDDIARVAGVGSPVADALASAGLTFLFERVVGDGFTDEEPTLRRRFRNPAARTFDLTGSLRLTDVTPDRSLDALLGGESGAYGSDRFAGRGDRRGRLAVDGDPETGWQVEPEPGARLTVRFPRQTITAVDVDIAVADAEGFGGAYSRPRSLTLEVPAADLAVVRELAPVADVVCEPTFSPGACIERHRFELPATAAASLDVRLGTVDVAVGDAGPVPVKITEVSVTSAATGEPVPPGLDGLPSGCVPMFELDGESIGVRLLGTVDALVAGAAVAFEGCAPVALDRGDHAFSGDAALSGLVEYVALASPPAVPDGTVTELRASTAVRARVVERSPTRLVVDLRVPAGGGYLVGGQSFDRRWGAKIGGRSLGPADPVDTLVAWRLPAGRHRVVVSYAPQRRYEMAMAVAAAGLVVCLALSLHRREPG